ncbi:MAG: AbrB family transcriptional regulator [Burkholderiaceae bacterium]|nr:MAG: AbrB family transcriptional regulator [Burkholderiaceae bacterium]
MTLLIGFLAAQAAVFLYSPLPWMIGPLFVVSLGRLRGWPLAVFPGGRQMGQWMVGTTLGLYFTPAINAQLLHFSGAIVLGTVYALALGLACALLLRRWSHVDFVTAFFSMAIGGSSEMSLQGERHGAPGYKVAAAHSVRLMLVVMIIPFSYKFLGLHRLDPYTPAVAQVHYGGLLWLIAATVPMALLFHRLGAANAWVLGPLLASLLLTANSVELTAMPRWIVNGGQLLLGCTLASRFSPLFIHEARRFLGAVVRVVLVALAVSALFGWLLASAIGVHPATMILATSPGGIAEMTLTARVLELGVPLVTAFHVTRAATLILCVGPLYRWLARKFKD